MQAASSEKCLREALSAAQDLTDTDPELRQDLLQNVTVRPRVGHARPTRPRSCRRRCQREQSRGCSWRRCSGGLVVAKIRCPRRRCVHRVWVILATSRRATLDDALRRWNRVCDLGQMDHFLSFCVDWYIGAGPWIV